MTLRPTEGGCISTAETRERVPAPLSPYKEQIVIRTHSWGDLVKGEHPILLETFTNSCF